MFYFFFFFCLITKKITIMAIYKTKLYASLADLLNGSSINKLKNSVKNRVDNEADELRLLKQWIKDKASFEPINEQKIKEVLRKEKVGFWKELTENQKERVRENLDEINNSVKHAFKKSDSNLINEMMNKIRNGGFNAKYGREMSSEAGKLTIDRSRADLSQIGHELEHAKRFKSGLYDYKYNDETLLHPRMKGNILNYISHTLPEEMAAARGGVMNSYLKLGDKLSKEKLNEIHKRSMQDLSTYTSEIGGYLPPSLDYHMDPETLRKFKENLKKL